jgi:monothiol glutaredoxin
LEEQRRRDFLYTCRYTTGSKYETDRESLKPTFGTENIGDPQAASIFSWGSFVIYSVMQTPEITAYLKTYCGWSAGVRAVLAKYNLPYTEKDIIQNPAFRWEMETKSGQPLSPCVEVNGQMLADVSGEEVEQYLIDHKLVRHSDAATDVPTNAPCPTEQHEGVVKLNL